MHLCTGEECISYFGFPWPGPLLFPHGFRSIVVYKEAALRMHSAGLENCIGACSFCFGAAFGTLANARRARALIASSSFLCRETKRLDEFMNEDKRETVAKCMFRTTKNACGMHEMRVRSWLVAKHQSTSIVGFDLFAHCNETDSPVDMDERTLRENIFAGLKNAYGVTWSCFTTFAFFNKGNKLNIFTHGRRMHLHFGFLCPGHSFSPKEAATRMHLAGLEKFI